MKVTPINDYEQDVLEGIVAGTDLGTIALARSVLTIEGQEFECAVITAIADDPEDDDNVRLYPLAVLITGEVEAPLFERLADPNDLEDVVDQDTLRHV